jgi:outer membrane receptor protein involved in Fe transport
LAGSIPPIFQRLANYEYFDLTASYVLNKTVSFRVGANNILDKDPPYTSQDYFVPPFSSENTYPQVYDALGRFLFANITLNF